MSDALTTGTVSDRRQPGVRVGVLSFHSSTETKALLNAVAALGHEPIWLREDNVRAWMADGELHVDPAVDVVVNRLLATKAARPLDDLGVAASYLTTKPVLNPPGAVSLAMHKFGAAATLAAAGIPVPDAYMAFSSRTMASDEPPFGGPAVHKPAIGTNGKRMRLLEERERAAPRIARRRAFLQEFLEPDTGRPWDVRVYVVDGDVVGAMRRYAPPDEWRTNVALGGDVEDVTASLPWRARDYARRATETLELDYAGVDLLHRRGRWYVLEVNATAGFKGFFEATGISPAPAIVRAAVERAGGAVGETAVAELRTVLDGSAPGPEPSPEERDDRCGTVGFTERVTVAGERGQERVTAKADTGARRTSVDLEVAASVGAGAIVGTTRVRSGVGGTGRRRPLVDLDLEIGSRWHRTTASVEDRSHLAYPVLLGRDVLGGYRVDVRRRADEE